jgi:hypothetical protein
MVKIRYPYKILTKGAKSPKVFKVDNNRLLPITPKWKYSFSQQDQITVISPPPQQHEQQHEKRHHHQP